MCPVPRVAAKYKEDAAVLQCKSLTLLPPIMYEDIVPVDIAWAVADCGIRVADGATFETAVWLPAGVTFAYENTFAGKMVACEFVDGPAVGWFPFKPKLTAPGTCVFVTGTEGGGGTCTAGNNDVAVMLTQLLAALSHSSPLHCLETSTDAAACCFGYRDKFRFPCLNHVVASGWRGRNEGDRRHGVLVFAAVSCFGNPLVLLFFVELIGSPRNKWTVVDCVGP
uniref:Uncharacterized protein n=1 Tax=Glossina brevipalpis TaxID=37001 RepID=A0A1A9WCX8_9MUSC